MVSGSLILHPRAWFSRHQEISPLCCPTLIFPWAFTETVLILFPALIKQLWFIRPHASCGGGTSLSSSPVLWWWGWGGAHFLMVIKPRESQDEGGHLAQFLWTVLTDCRCAFREIPFCLRDVLSQLSFSASPSGVRSLCTQLRYCGN